jgi:hypothetical protein
MLTMRARSQDPNRPSAPNSARPMNPEIRGADDADAEGFGHAHRVAAGYEQPGQQTDQRPITTRTITKLITLVSS